MDNESTSRGLPPSPAEPVPAEFDLLCERCGYSLVGLVHSNRCPECGRKFDPNVLPLARVPWLYRVRLGWWQAYWDTVWLILRDPASFATDLCRPVRICAPEAKRFRRMTGWIAAGSTFILGLLAGVLLLVVGDREAPIAIAMSVGLLAGIRVFVHAATDMPTFIWEGPDATKPHELSPLQHYASAPVSLLGIPAGLVGLQLVLAALQPMIPLPVTATLVSLAIVCGGFIAYQFLRISVTFMRVATGCTARRQLVLAMYLPVHWLLLGILSGILTMIATMLAMAVVYTWIAWWAL